MCNQISSAITEFIIDWNCWQLAQLNLDASLFKDQEQGVAHFPRTARKFRNIHRTSYLPLYKSTPGYSVCTSVLREMTVNIYQKPISIRNVTKKAWKTPKPSTKKWKWSLLEAQGSKHYIPACKCRIEDNSYNVCFGFCMRFWENALHPALDLENLSKPHDPSAQSLPYISVIKRQNPIPQ